MKTVNPSAKALYDLRPEMILDALNAANNRTIKPEEIIFSAPTAAIIGHMDG